MNYIVVYDPPGGSTWDLSPELKQGIQGMDAVAAVRRSRVYSLQPEIFADVPRPRTVLCWGVEDRYDYEGREVDEVIYVSGMMDIDYVVKGLRLVKTGENSYMWTTIDEIPPGYVRQMQRGGPNGIPTKTCYVPEGEAE